MVVIRDLDASDAFEVVWDDPATEETHWSLDREHHHGVLTRFEIESSVVSSKVAMDVDSIVVNGHVFTGTPTFPAPPREMRGQHYSEFWDGTYRDEAIAAARTVLDRDDSALSDAELAATIAEDMETVSFGFRSTQMPVFKMFMQLHPFSEFCRAQYGDPDGLLMQYRMLQGYETESTDAALGLERLAELIDGDEGLMALLESGAVDEARADEGASAFFAGFDVYIERYGWRAEIWSDLSTPTWAEDATVPLAMIVRYARSPETRPSVALAAAAADRATAITEAMERLGDDDAREQLRGFLDEHEPYSRVREGRAHWQLVLAGSIRKPLMDLGRRMAKRGLVDRSEDVLHLESGELVALCREQIDGQALVAERRERYEHWQTLSAPDFLGAEAGPSPLEMMTQTVPEERVSADGKSYSGTAASAGVAYGRARVATDLSEALLLEPGEVLVCRTTAPPWTPLFAVASAVVTEGGDIMAHTAIVAREYKIPAVLGISDATSVIPNGAMVTVDGDRGMVRLD